MATTTFAFENNRSEAFDVYVEPWPELFRLQSGERLEFRYEAPPAGETISISVHEEGITLWTGIGDEPEFLIDGKPANERSWKL
jgi:hypothetical protein